MSASQANNQPNARPRGQKLSPELNEFLHMLDALEGQLGSKDEKVQGKS